METPLGQYFVFTGKLVSIDDRAFRVTADGMIPLYFCIKTQRLCIILGVRLTSRLTDLLK